MKMISLSDGYTLLTKANCKWCTKAKELLPRAQVIHCDSLLQDRDGFFQEVDLLSGRQYRMFPMVFYNSMFIGGYSELKHKLDTELTFDVVHF